MLEKAKFLTIARDVTLAVTLSVSALTESACSKVDSTPPPSSDNATIRSSETPNYTLINAKGQMLAPYYSLDIDSLFNPDGSMNISSSILTHIKQDAATRALVQYSQNHNISSLQVQQLENLIDATDFLDRTSYNEIKERLIKENKIKNNRSVNDIYIFSEDRLIFNRNSEYLTRKAPTKNETIRALNKNGYPTLTALIYLQSAYQTALSDFPPIKTSMK